MSKCTFCKKKLNRLIDNVICEPCFSWYNPETAADRYNNEDYLLEGKGIPLSNDDEGEGKSLFKYDYEEASGRLEEDE